MFRPIDTHFTDSLLSTIFAIISSFKASYLQLEENQSKLLSLETVFNRLESKIDDDDSKGLGLRQELDKIHKSNSKLMKKLVKSSWNSGMEVVLTIWVFDSMLRGACRSLHSFTKLLIDLMKKAGCDLDLAANSVQSGVNYAKRRHNRYAFFYHMLVWVYLEVLILKVLG